MKRLLTSLVFLICTFVSVAVHAQSSGNTPPPPPVCGSTNAGALYTDTGTSPATVYTCSYYNLAWQWVVNPSYGGLVYYPTVPATCEGALPAFLAGWPNTNMYICVNGFPELVSSEGGINHIPFCTGFSPTEGQTVEWTALSTPNPCWTAATGGGGMVYPGANTIGVGNSSNTAWRTPSYADILALWSGTKDAAHCTAGDGTMQPCSGGGGSLNIEHNGTPVPFQTTLNFGDLTPAAGAGYVNGTFLNDSIGGMSVEVPAIPGQNAGACPTDLPTPTVASAHYVAWALPNGAIYGVDTVYGPGNTAYADPSSGSTTVGTNAPYAAGNVWTGLSAPLLPANATVTDVIIFVQLTTTGPANTTVVGFNGLFPSYGANIPTCTWPGLVGACVDYNTGLPPIPVLNTEIEQVNLKLTSQATSGPVGGGSNTSFIGIAIIYTISSGMPPATECSNGGAVATGVQQVIAAPNQGLQVTPPSGGPGQVQIGMLPPLSGAGAPSATCSATVNNGLFYRNTSSITSLYQCSNASGSYEWDAIGGGGGSFPTLTAGAPVVANNTNPPQAVPQLFYPNVIDSGAGTVASPWTNSTDGNAGIQTMLTALEGSGSHNGCVLLAPGVYLIHTPIVMQGQSDCIEGESWGQPSEPNYASPGTNGVILKLDPTLNCATTNCNIIQVGVVNGNGNNRATGPVVKNIYFEGNTTTLPSTWENGACLSINGWVDQAHFSNINATNCPVGVSMTASGGSASQSDASTLDGGSLIGNGIGVLMRQGDGPSPYNTVRNMVIADNLDQGIYLEGCGGGSPCVYYAVYDDIGIYNNTLVRNCYSAGCAAMTGKAANIYSERYGVNIQGNRLSSAGQTCCGSSWVNADGIILVGNGGMVTNNQVQYQTQSSTCGVRVLGNGNHVIGLSNSTVTTESAFLGNVADLCMASGATDTQIQTSSSLITDAGTRTVVNHYASNAGDPASAGNWASAPKYDGLHIWDSSDSILWYYTSPTTRQQINGGGGGTTTNALTFATSGGAAPSGTFNGSAAVTIDYHSVGAQPALSLLAGTYANGDMCTYASSGTLLNCNTAIPSSGLSGMTSGQVALAGSSTTITSSIAYATAATASTLVERDSSGNINANAVNAGTLGTYYFTEKPLSTMLASWTEDVTTAATALASLGGVPTTTTVNGHALSSNVVVSASDITTGTLPVAQLPTAIDTRTVTVTDVGPVTADDGLIVVLDPATAVQLTRFSCGVTGTTSVITNLVSGGNSLIADMTATAGTVNQVVVATWVSGSCSSQTTYCPVAAHTPVTLHIGTISGTPTSLSCALDYAVN